MAAKPQIPGAAAGRRGKPPQSQSPRPAGANRVLWRYLASFLGVAVGLFAIYQLSESTHRFRYVNEGNAALCGTVMGWFGIDNTRIGTSLRMPGGGMEIISECSAIYVGILFTAGVLAFPTTWRARFAGLALGLPCIFAINLLRLVSLGAIIRYRASLLPLFHEYLWQVLFVLVVAGLYLLWIERYVPRARAGQTA